MKKNNPMECHGTLVKHESCGCLMEKDFNVPVERSATCRDPEHEPCKKPRYNKKHDLAIQAKMELTGSAKDIHS